MNTGRMFEIAALLREYYLDRAGRTLKEWQLNKDLEARRLALTPPEGWPGKNAEARNLAEKQAYAADETVGKIEAQAAFTHDALVNLDAEIAGLEAERRALEWEVRARMVDALLERHIDPSQTDQAFDEVQQYGMDERLFDEVPF